MAADTTRRGVNRREALRTLAAGAGAAATALWVEDLALLADQMPHTHLLAASAQGGSTWAPAVLTPAQLETVATIAELIIPATETPGARAAQVDRFIDGVLANAAPATRNEFLAGLAWIDTRSQTLASRPFTAATPAQQVDLLTRLSNDPSSEAPVGSQFFTAIKSMTISGYYSSEIGLRQELGDDGILMAPAFTGCTHPEHQV